MTRRTPFERDFADLHGPEIIEAEVVGRRPRASWSWRPPQTSRRPDWKTFVIGLPLIALLSAVMIPLAYVAFLAVMATAYLVGSFWQGLFS